MFFVDPSVNDAFTARVATSIVDALNPGNNIHEMLFDTSVLESVVNDLQQVEFYTNKSRYGYKSYHSMLGENIIEGLASLTQFLTILTRSDSYRCQLSQLLSDEKSLKVLKLGLESTNTEEKQYCTTLLRQMCTHKCNRHSSDVFVKLLTKREIVPADSAPPATAPAPPADLSKLPTYKLVPKPGGCGYGDLCLAFFQSLDLPGKITHSRAKCILIAI